MTGVALVRRSFERGLQVIADMPVIDLVARMTLLLLILHSGYFWYLRVPMVLLCIAGLVSRRLYADHRFWLLICCVMAIGNLYNWFSIDNHKYLMLYWCIAMYLCLLAQQPARAIALQAKLLIALVFALATLWKLITPDYMDGRFFEFTLLTDPRFGGTAMFVGGMSEQQLAENQYLMRMLASGQDVHREVRLQMADGIGPLALLISWWVVAIEGVIAVLFLLPDRAWSHYLRDGALLVFSITTYMVATVIGFGWLLMIMGIAQCPDSHRVTRFLYFITFLAILVYMAPWTGLIVQSQLLD